MRALAELGLADAYGVTDLPLLVQRPEYAYELPTMAYSRPVAGSIQPQTSQMARLPVSVVVPSRVMSP